MKTLKNNINVIVLLGALSSGITMAQTTTYYGVQNNAAAAGVTGATYATIPDTNWHDAMIDQGLITRNTGADQLLQVSGRKTGGLGNTNGRQASLITWDNLIIPDTISDARYYFYVGLNQGGTNRYYITPINANTNWTESSATWSSMSLNFDTSATTNEFIVEELNEKTWMSVNITSLLQGYQAGTNDGFALVRDIDYFGTASQEPLFTFGTSENQQGFTPGLKVTTIPEPSSVLIGLLGVIGLVIRRRR